MKNHRVTGLVEVQSEDCGILWNHGISWPQTMWSDVKRCEATWDGLQHVKSGMVAIPSDPHQDLSWKMAIWPTARPWSAAPRGPRGPRTSEQKGQGHFEKDIARHYGNITPKIRTKVTKLLGLECLECFEWEFRFRFTVIHQVVSSGNEFSGSQRAGIWHLDLQRSVPRGAQDSTGRHRHLSYWSPVSAVGIRRNGNGRCEWPAVGSWYEGVGVPRFAGTEHMQSDTSSLAVAPDLWQLIYWMLEAVGNCWELLETVGNFFKCSHVDSNQLLVSVSADFKHHCD